ncbi:glycosyltransferase [Fusobacterium sp.]|uniref:glycosyltransferase n=1 Tax=Fusobacterium sp. TaxID=68766 RepID=UPI0026312618|nr:glycosyltransferase [Fusobacterium sp.]
MEKNRKNIKELIIAEADSFWTKRFIENVSLPLQHRVTIISPTNTVNSEFYNENKVKIIISSNSDSFLDKIPRIRVMYRENRLKKIIEKEEYDYLHIFYASQSSMKVVNLLKNSHNIIITYWGSDLLRANNLQIKTAIKVIKRADFIIVMTEDMKKFFQKYYGENISKRVSVIDMGVSAFTYIDKLRGKQEECKKFYLNKSENRIFITVAYNADINQQHIKIIEALSLLPEEIKKKCFIVLPMTYRKLDNNYILSVKKKIASSGFEYCILEKFMDDFEISRLCVATDLFINAQTTDAQSSSMLEHLYANTKVLNGAWLNYSFLEKNDIFCRKFNDFKELSDLIYTEIKDMKFKDGKKGKIQQILYEECSWENCKNKWEYLLNR